MKIERPSLYEQKSREITFFQVEIMHFYLGGGGGAGIGGP